MDYAEVNEHLLPAPSTPTQQRQGYGSNSEIARQTVHLQKSREPHRSLKEREMLHRQTSEKDRSGNAHGHSCDEWVMVKPCEQRSSCRKTHRQQGTNAKVDPEEIADLKFVNIHSLDNGFCESV